jgi:DNA mismatch repair protein MutL
VHLSLPPEDVDANIHPAKAEVRFAREREVHGVLHRAVAGTLLEHHHRERGLGSTANGANEDGPGEQAALNMALEEPAAHQAEVPGVATMPALRVFGQSNATFIIAEGPQGLYMIDQHAAHERILFDHFEGALENGAPPVQPLLEPATVPLDSDMMLALDTNAALLQSFGFGLEPFGDSACLVRAIPSLGGRVGPVELVQEVLTELRHLPEPSAARERALAAMACKAAVKAGQTLRIEEMRELVHGLENTLRPQTCPHGRPTMIHLSHSRLEREFGRR